MKSAAITSCLIACLAVLPAAAQDQSATNNQATEAAETAPAQQAGQTTQSADTTTVPETATATVPSSLSANIISAIGTPSPGKAMVVFFRPSKFVGAAVGFKVRENDVELGKLRNGNYFAIEVEPGQHSYVVHSEAKDVTTIEAEAGETYFLSGSLNFGVVAGRPNLSPSDAAAFEAVLPKLKKSKPLD
jgi:hypothetical protein